MHEIKLLNSLSKKIEAFVPLSPGVVKMYCCGVTPYSHLHLGHLRTFFSYDLLYRTFSDAGYQVEWARNITDVDDKIIAKASSENTTCEKIVKRYIDEQNLYLKKFSLYQPKFEPKVTENIDNIIEHIKTLIDKEFAYVSQSGVYFRVSKFEEYGKLSGNSIESLIAGARIEVDESKEKPVDFALWKFEKENEISWESPWGPGRPGWHIECSAMIHSHFGDQIDIHMGGRDLIFPHHEAEIAQSEAFTGKTFSQFWLHTGMVTLNGEKMSKSTKHFITISEFLERFPAEVIRLIFLSSNYSQPMDFSYEIAEENLKKLVRLYRFSALVQELLNSGSENTNPAYSIPLFSELKSLESKMQMCLYNNLNANEALAILFSFIKKVNGELTKLLKEGYYLHKEDTLTLKSHFPRLLNWIRNTLGLLKSEDFFEDISKLRIEGHLSQDAILEKIRSREQARLAKDWATSDTIRKELLEAGICLQDTPTGTKWTLDI